MEDGNGWESPLLLWHSFSANAAHDQARRLRRIWHGHLVAVTRCGRTPKSSPPRPHALTA